MKAIKGAISETLIDTFGEELINIDEKYVYGSEDISVMDILIPSFPGFIAMFFSFIISGILLLRERLTGTLERMLVSAIKPHEIFFGYLIAFSIVATIQSAIVILIALFFSIEILKHFLLIYILVLLLAVGSVSMSISLAFRMKTELQVIQMIPIFIVPQFFLSGMIVSIDALPQYLRPISYIMPLTYYVNATKKIIFMQASLPDIFLHMLALLLYFAIGMILGSARLRVAIQ